MKLRQRTLHQLDATHRGCLCVLPARDKKTTQRLAIGDTKGTLFILNMMNSCVSEEARVETPGQAVHSLALAGLFTKPNQLYVSYGSVIRAFDFQVKKQAELDTHSN